MITRRKASVGHIQKEERNVIEYHYGKMNKIQRKAGREEQDPQHMEKKTNKCQ